MPWDIVTVFPVVPDPRFPQLDGLNRHILMFVNGEENKQLVLDFDLEIMDYGFTFDNGEFTLVGHGPTKILALVDLCENVNFVWKDIALAEDSTLNEYAQVLKQRWLQAATNILISVEDSKNA